MLEEGVSIGAFTVVGRGVRLRRGVRLETHVVVGDHCELGEDTVVLPHATLYSDVVLGPRSVVHAGACLGPDGFGFAYADGAHRKIAQVGGVRFGGAGEVGPNSTVDRGSVGHTVLGVGCALGSLVHVGHNARMGDSVSIDSLAGVAGSAILGNGISVGGQVAIVGHLTVGDGVTVARWGGVTQDVPAGEAVFGTPARSRREARRAELLLARLPRLVKRLQALERLVLGRGRAAGPD